METGGRVGVVAVVALLALSGCSVGNTPGSAPASSAESAPDSSFVPNEFRAEYVKQAVDYYYKNQMNGDPSLLCGYYKFSDMGNARAQVYGFVDEAAHSMAEEYDLCYEERGVFGKKLAELIGVGCGAEIPSVDQLPPSAKSEEMLGRGRAMAAAQTGNGMKDLCKDMRLNGTMDYIKSIQKAAVSAGEVAPSEVDAQYVLAGLTENCP